MAILKSIFHFIAAAVLGVLAASYIAAMLPLEAWLHWPIAELSCVLGSFVGGAILGLNTHLPRRLGAWLGCTLALTVVFWGTYVAAFMYARLDMPTNLMAKGLTRIFGEHAATLLGCALGGYCGQ